MDELAELSLRDPFGHHGLPIAIISDHPSPRRSSNTSIDCRRSASTSRPPYSLGRMDGPSGSIGPSSSTYDFMTSTSETTGSTSFYANHGYHHACHYGRVLIASTKAIEQAEFLRSVYKTLDMEMQHAQATPGKDDDGKHVPAKT